MIENDHSCNGREAKGGRSRFHLDGVREEDYPELLHWMNDLDELPSWTVRRKPMLQSDLVQHIENRTRSAFFVIIRHTESAEAAGFADATIRERHEIAEFECYVDTAWRTRGAVAAIAQVIRHLFVNWPLRKLYCQTFAYNEESTKILARIGFEEAGRFREFVWREDGYWDRIVFCLDRATRQAAVAGEGRFREHTLYDGRY